MRVKLPTYSRTFFYTEEGLYTRYTYITTTSRNNQSNKIFEQLLEFFFVCLFFYRDLSSNNILDLDAGVFSNLTNLREL